MAIIPNPQSELLREPNLLVPGKKPVGNVKVDWDHPLADNLYSSCLLGPGPRDLVNHNRVIEHAVAGNYGAGVEGGEKVGYSTSTGSTVVGFHLDNFAANPDAHTFITKLYLGKLDTDLRLFEVGEFAPLFWLDQLGDGTMRLGSHTGGTTYSAAVITSVGWYTAACTFSWPAGSPDQWDIRLYLDGKEVANDIDGENKTGVTNGILNRADQEQGALFENKDSLCAYWHYWQNRALTAGQIREVTSDPYQFLIPA